MHGFGLSFLLDNSLRHNSSSLAFSRSLRDRDDSGSGTDGMDDSWAQVEYLDHRDRLLIGLFKKNSKSVAHTMTQL